MIKCTDVDLVKLAQEAFRLSVPQGMGFLPFTPEPLSKSEAEQLIDKNSAYSILSMDYVHGRAVKLTVKKDKDGELSLPDNWYDHTDAQYAELLKSVGLESADSSDHSCACNCQECQYKRLVESNKR